MKTKLFILSAWFLSSVLSGILIHDFAFADSKTMIVGSTTNVSTGANTACTTTCSSSCIVGFDTGTLGVALPHIVACNSATADECLCS
jgi:hypothetical protein